MLDEKQQAAQVEGITAADIIICLQIIQRLVATGSIQDQELAAVGAARNNLVEGLEKATGVNFDMARAAQQRALKEAQERQRQAALAAQQAAPEAPVEAPAEPAVAEAANDEAPAAGE